MSARHALLALPLVFLAACASGPVGDGDGLIDPEEAPQVGWVAELEGFHHDVAGTATIVDENTIEIEGFTYDGRGLDARLFLIAEGAMFNEEVPLSEDLVGTPFDDELLVLDVPDGAFEDTNLLTLWCVPAAEDFGHGVFLPPGDLDLE